MSPQLWFIAGPNGAGKSTVGPKLLQVLEAPPNMTLLNPDALSQGRRLIFDGLPVPGLLRRTRAWRACRSAIVDYPAVVTVKSRLERAIRNRESIALETVLSSRKYLSDLRTAREQGFTIGMVFVVLPNWELHADRVQMRVASGGHPVPREKVESRWYTSHTVLAEVVPMLDRLVVVNNANPHQRPEVVCERTEFGEPLRFYSATALPHLFATLRCFGR